MNPHERRRRGRGLIYLLIVFLALPPGQVFAATNRRINTLSRATAVETFRNPQISSAAHNRFLFSQSPRDLLGRGGDDFTNPDTRGLGRGTSEPDTLWLTHDGAIEWFDTDLSMPGVGLHLAFTRVYRGSVSSYEGPLGDQWEFNWNRRISQASSTSDAIFYDMGRKETYAYNAGDFDSPAGRYDTLEFDATPDPDVFTRTDKYGIVETYEFDETVSSVDWYRLASIEDLNGNTVSFAYDGDGLLTTVTDTLDRDTTLSYDGNDRVTKITDSASREWVYGYDEGGLLTTVRTPVVDLNDDETEDEDEYLSGKTTSYEYDGSNRLTAVLQPEDTTTGTWTWSYNGSGRVTAHSKNGDGLTISYGTSPDYTEVNDREGETSRYEYDGSLRITKRLVNKPTSGTWDTSYSYNSDNEVTEVVYPRGNRIAYGYDGDGNVTKVEFKEDGSDATPITWEYAYTGNARLDTIEDPNGNVWDFDWDTDGNLTKRTAPSVTVPSGIATSDFNNNSVYDGTIIEEWEYNGSGLVTKHTDAVGTETAYAYTTVNSKPAYLASVTRDSGTGGLALVTAYAYDAAGNVTQVTDPKSNVTTYTVNDLNQVLTVVEPGSVTKKYHYDANDRLTKTEAENDTDVGNSWYVVDREYDQVGNLTKLIEDETASTRLTTTYAYDDNERLTKTTSPEGNETTREYDTRNFLTKVTRKAASASDDAVTQYDYDENGNRVEVTDPRGKVTTYAFDLYDRMTKMTQPLGNYVEYAYDANSNVTKTTWKNSSNTKLAERTVAFDQANRVYQIDDWAKKADLSTNLGDGTKSRFTWRDERGAVISHTGDICGCELYEHIYDALGRQVTTKDPMGVSDATRNLVVTEYDDNGNVTKSTRKERTQDSGIEADKDIVVEYVYDARDRMVTRKDKLGASTYANTVYHYGKRDQLTKVVDGVSDEVRTEYDEQLRKTKVTQENGSADVVTEFTYDDDGRLVTYRAKNATTGDQDTVYAYDNLGRVVTITWPDSETHVYTYDKASNRISTTDPNGTVTVAAYDDNNRLTSKAITLGSNVVGTTSLTFGYDGMNRRTSADMAEGGSYSSQIEWTYNSLSKPETEKQVIDGYNSGSGRTITYTYNGDGQKTGVEYPVSGEDITYTLDNLDRIDTIVRGSTTVVDYAFNGRRVIEKQLPGSVGEYTYDAFGRLTAIHHKDSSSGNTLAKFEYGYDDAHMVTHQDKYYYDDVQNTRLTTETGDLGDQYRYDGAKRLDLVLRGVPSAEITTAIATNITNNDYLDKIDYVYDPTGNRETRKLNGSNNTLYEYNAVNEMTKEAGVTQLYWDNGTFNRASTGSTKQYKHNHDDQLADYKVDSSLSYLWHFDALGRRIEREAVGTGGTSDSRWYYDGIHDVETVTWASSAETLKLWYVFGETTDEVLEYVYAVPNPDDVYYFHTDMLGSIQLAVDSSGAIQESYRYKEFGETTVVDSSFNHTTRPLSDIHNSKRYTGRDRIVAGTFGDDWYHYRARTYRPDAGRFVQRDPVFAANGYSYVDSQPLAATDPTGRTAIQVTDDVRPSQPTGTGKAGGQVGPQILTPTYSTPGSGGQLSGSCIRLSFSLTATNAPLPCGGSKFLATPMPQVQVDDPTQWDCRVKGYHLKLGYDEQTTCGQKHCDCGEITIECTGLKGCAQWGTFDIPFTLSACMWSGSKHWYYYGQQDLSKGKCP